MKGALALAALLALMLPARAAGRDRPLADHRRDRDRYATAAERAQPALVRLVDPRASIHTGVRLLAELLRRHGRVDHALAAWNAGEAAVRRHGGLPPIDETRAHVHQVLELYWALLQRSLASTARSLALP